MKAKKVLALVLCAALLVAGSVAATLAYLTSQTDTISNVFTVGNVKITMDEAKVDVYGVEDKNADRVSKGEQSYKLIPGHTYVKDPTIYVDANSENCWLFVKVEDGIVDIQAEKTVAAQMVENGWDKVAGEKDVWYHAVAKAGDKVPVFGSFTVKADADVATYNGKAIKVTAYAVQADNFGSAAEAWEVVK